jgi:hypothetical protein
MDSVRQSAHRDSRRLRAVLRPHSARCLCLQPLSRADDHDVRARRQRYRGSRYVCQCDRKHAGPRSFLVAGQRVAGDFSPRGTTWNAQVEHAFSKLLHVRGVYTDNRSVGLIVMHPDTLGSENEIVLDGAAVPVTGRLKSRPRRPGRTVSNWCFPMCGAGRRAIKMSSITSSGISPSPSSDPVRIRICRAICRTAF